MQQKLDVALEEELDLPATLTMFQRKEILKTTYNTIFLHLSNNFLRQVNNCTTTATMWKKLDKLYLVRSVPNKFYLLEQLFGLKMNSAKTLEQNLDYFNKIVLALGNANKKFDDKDIAPVCFSILNSIFYSI